MPIQLSDKREHILEFLRNHNIGVLATVDPNGEPSAATIYFTVDDELNISFITKTGTKKHDNLIRQNHAMLVVYEASSQTTVEIVAIASAITGASEVQDVFADILKISKSTSGSDVPPISKLNAGKYVGYRLESKEIRMATFVRTKSGDYDTIFEILDL
jgi:general stress protein 26